MHIDYIVSKISAKIGVLRSLRKIIPTATLKLLYNAIVLPHFDYADVVYDSASETSKSKLQKRQSRAAKLISGSGPRANRNPIYKSLDWLSFQYRRDFHNCILVYKCYNNLAPSYLVDMFNSNDSVHNYNTRHASQLMSTQTRTAYYHKSFTVSGHTLWNDLPYNIQNCNTLPSFKNALCKLYLTKTQL